MEVSDSLIMEICDWDLNYLRVLFDQEFYDFTDHWKSNVMDSDLVKETEYAERYCPVVEDISLDDNVLYEAVEHIEEEYVSYKIVLISTISGFCDVDIFINFG